MPYKDADTRRAKGREYSRRWREAHRDGWRARDRAHQKIRYAEHRAEIRARRRVLRAARVEIVRAQNRASYARHIERRRLDARARRPRTPEEKLRLREYQRLHYRRNPGYYAHRQIGRRSRKAGASGSHTLAEWQDKVALLGGVCFYCGKEKPLRRDHKIPLSRGGSNYIENILPACHSCNSRKYTKTTAEFLALGGAA